MHIIGLTGSMASGKSTAAKIFRSKGIPVLDCDAIVHEVQNNNPFLNKKLQKLFPAAFVKGKLDRLSLSRLVMDNPKALAQVEQITLPIVHKELCSRIKQYRKDRCPLIVIDAPLLFEKKLDQKCDSTICLYVAPDVQKARFLGRPGATEAKFETIMAKQMPVEEKKKRATFHIISDTAENLNNQINTLVTALSFGLKKQHQQALSKGRSE